MRQLDNPIWEAGYEAYHNMVARTANPYPEDSQESDTWDDGWDCADSDTDDEIENYGTIFS